MIVVEWKFSGIERVGSPGSALRAERRATPLVRGGASNHGSWRKNVVNSYSNHTMKTKFHSMCLNMHS